MEEESSPTKDTLFPPFNNDIAGDLKIVNIKFSIKNRTVTKIEIEKLKLL